MKYPQTPDGRYFLVRGRLWRSTDPSIPEDRRQELVNDLMRGMRMKRAGDKEAGRQVCDAAKIALGERGPVWWTDGAPDYNRRMAANTPYREWEEAL